jgi:hypothetical protein
MRNLLALGAAGLLGFAGIGWYLGWYRVQTTPTADGHRQISIDLNTPKIKEDVGKGKEKLRDFLSSDDNGPAQVTPSNNANPPPSGVTPAGFQRSNDGGVVLPANDNSAPFAPQPPSGSSPRLPTPR